MTPRAHRARARRRVPTSTYRVQLGSSVTFDIVATHLPYYASLGVSHLYLSPILQCAPGSTHGYDVVDHDTVAVELGGVDGLRRLAAAAHGHGMGLVADIVPNHMAIPVPAYLNKAWWSVLREGPHSPYATWFDIDWTGENPSVLVPLLGERVGEALAEGKLTLGQGGADGTEPVLRYLEHEVPLREGTASLPVAELLDRQWYRLAHWRVSVDELNYRRFFDVSSLAGLRVERPEVFEATHRLLLALVAEGTLDGLRVDHPDGLADPAAYLERLADATADAWVVVEKILEGDERLPGSWRCAGTTGYDALWRVQGVFVDSQGAAGLAAVHASVSPADVDLTTVVAAAKEEVARTTLHAEVGRLVADLEVVCSEDVRLRDHTTRALTDAVVALLVEMSRYRAYVVPGEPADSQATGVVEQAALRARYRLDPLDHDTLELVRDLVLGREVGTAGLIAAPARAEVIVRFQQTCGPVMAKGVEDTAFYRWPRLLALTEVGSDPTRFGIDAAELFAYADHLVATWPTTMTTLSTHDTKRSEDVRARLVVLSERPVEWARWVNEARRLVPEDTRGAVDGATEYLFWQTLVGAWPVSAERLERYAVKAVREAGLRTSWTAPDSGYEEAVSGLAEFLATSDSVSAQALAWLTDCHVGIRAVTLGQKLLQLVLPGVCDVYQGCEALTTTLVDPDNRGPVDTTALARRLALLDAGLPPTDLSDEKLLVTASALRLRRGYAEWFVGRAAEVFEMESTSEHALGVGRGLAGEPRAIAVVTRLATRLAASGGWGDDTVDIPRGRWRDVLTGQAVASDGHVPLADLLVAMPVVLLVREDGA